MRKITNNALRWLVALTLLAALVGLGVSRMSTWSTSRNTPKLASTQPGIRSVTLTDLAGRTVTLRQPVDRIVLVRGRDVYELALLLEEDLPRKLVAWGPDLRQSDHDAYSVFTERFPSLAKLPEIGSVFADAVDAEAVLALRPDLVIVETFMAERGYKCLDRMERAGLPLLFLDFSRDPFQGPQRSIRLLGQALGREKRAAEVVDFVKARLDEVTSRLTGPPASPPSVYMECGYKGVKEYGHTFGYTDRSQLSAWGLMLDRLGCRNIAAGVAPPMAAMHPERLLTADPDVVVITGACWPATPDSMHLGYGTDAADAEQRLRAFATRPGWANLKAVKTRRVYGIFHGFCMHTMNFAALQQLAKWLYPERFAALDPAARLREFHDRFLPVACRGAWMISLEKAQ
ncbi:MAG: ABC transporter substrate-binding protein [Phycisphaerae bacterium]|nr:ABC transporter substrate-binding protein [Phycisphaerae bacterium]